MESASLALSDANEAPAPPINFLAPLAPPAVERSLGGRAGDCSVLMLSEEICADSWARLMDLTEPGPAFVAEEDDSCRLGGGWWWWCGEGGSRAAGPAPPPPCCCCDVNVAVVAGLEKSRVGGGG